MGTVGDPARTEGLWALTEESPVKLRKQRAGILWSGHKCCRTWREEGDLCGQPHRRKTMEEVEPGPAALKSLVQVHVVKFAEIRTQVEVMMSVSPVNTEKVGRVEQ